MKKITAKHLIALLRKYRILEYWKTQPYLCATVAVLSLLVLVMLFRNPDTVSAIADLCMAGAALYAAFTAKHWFKNKINDIGIKQTEKIILVNEKIVNDIILIKNNLFFLDQENMKSKRIEEEFKKKYIEQHVLDLAHNNESLNNNCAKLDYLIISLKKFNLKINNENSENILNYTDCITSFTKKTRSFILEYTNNISNQENLKQIIKSMDTMDAAFKKFENIKVSELITPDN